MTAYHAHCYRNFTRTVFRRADMRTSDVSWQLGRGGVPATRVYFTDFRFSAPKAHNVGHNVSNLRHWHRFNGCCFPATLPLPATYIRSAFHTACGLLLIEKWRNMAVCHSRLF